LKAAAKAKPAQKLLPSPIPHHGNDSDEGRQEKSAMWANRLMSLLLLVVLLGVLLLPC
jgi:hypothetical protein